MRACTSPWQPNTQTFCIVWPHLLEQKKKHVSWHVSLMKVVTKRPRPYLMAMSVHDNIHEALLSEAAKVLEDDPIPPLSPSPSKAVHKMQPCIFNVGRTWILGSPQKQNGHPVECMLILIPLPKQGPQHLWRLTYGLLAVAKLTGASIDVKDAGKVRNQKVAKLQIVLIPTLILIKKFILQQLSHDTRHCSIHNTNELHLLVSRAFWVKKIDGTTI